MRKVDDGEMGKRTGGNKEKEKIMSEIVATNVIANRLWNTDNCIWWNF